MRLFCARVHLRRHLPKRPAFSCVPAARECTCAMFGTKRKIKLLVATGTSAAGSQATSTVVSRLFHGVSYASWPRRLWIEDAAAGCWALRHMSDCLDLPC